MRGELRLDAADCDPGVGAPVSIRVSPRARRVGLRIDSAERKVELVLPRGVPASTGLRFLAAKREWIAARLQALPQPVPFVEGAVVPLLGVPHRIRRESDTSPPPVRMPIAPFLELPIAMSESASLSESLHNNSENPATRGAACVLLSSLLVQSTKIVAFALR